MNISVSMGSDRKWRMVETPICENCGKYMKGHFHEVKNYVINTEVEYNTFYCPDCGKED